MVPSDFEYWKELVRYLPLDQIASWSPCGKVFSGQRAGRTVTEQESELWRPQSIVRGTGGCYPWGLY